MKRVMVYATWVGVGLVGRAIAEQLLVDDLAILGAGQEELLASLKSAFESAVAHYSAGRKET